VIELCVLLLGQTSGCSGVLQTSRTHTSTQKSGDHKTKLKWMVPTTHQQTAPWSVHSKEEELFCVRACLLNEINFKPTIIELPTVIDLNLVDRRSQTGVRHGSGTQRRSGQKGGTGMYN
jgi:hypothetical protein